MEQAASIAHLLRFGGADLISKEGACFPWLVADSGDEVHDLAEIEQNQLKNPTDQTVFWLWTKIGRGEHSNFAVRTEGGLRASPRVFRDAP